MKIQSHNTPVYKLVRLTDKVGMKLVRLRNDLYFAEYLFSTDGTLTYNQEERKVWYEDLSNQEIYDIVMMFTVNNEQFVNKYKASIYIEDSIVVLINILNKRNKDESTRTDI